MKRGHFKYIPIDDKQCVAHSLTKAQVVLLITAEKSFGIKITLVAYFDLLLPNSVVISI